MWGDGGCIVSIFIWGFRLRLDRKLQEAVQTGSGLQYRLDRKWSEYRLDRKWCWLCIKENHRQRIFSIKQFIWIWIFLYISAIVFLWLCRLMGRTRYHTYFFWGKKKMFPQIPGIFYIHIIFIFMMSWKEYFGGESHSYIWYSMHKVKTIHTQSSFGSINAHYLSECVHNLKMYTGLKINISSLRQD